MLRTGGVSWLRSCRETSAYLIDWHAACIVLVVSFAVDQLRRYGILPPASGTAGGRRGGQIVPIEV